MTTPGGLFGGLGSRFRGIFRRDSTAMQFFTWGVLYGVASRVAEPVMQDLSNEVWSKHPVMPLSPAEAATAVLRGHMGRQDAEKIAAQSGINADDFHTLFLNVGTPPALQDILSLWRRGKATDADLEKAVRQLPVRDEWLPLIKQLGVIPPSPNEVLQAYLEGQIPEGESKKRYEEAGGDPTWFQNAYNTRGQAPTPTESLELLNRGIIGERGKGPDSTSYEQAFLEGPWRNKWLDPFLALKEYLPPPRTVTAMFHEGSLTRAEAIGFLRKHGLTAQLAAKYTFSGSTQKTQSTRDVTRTMITDAFEARAIDRSTAVTMLKGIGYDEHEAQFVVQVAKTAEVRRFQTQAVNAIHDQFMADRIDENKAISELDSENIPATQRNRLIGLWKLQRKAVVHKLTPTQVRDAHKKNLITEANAIGRLIGDGYSEPDARILLQL